MNSARSPSLRNARAAFKLDNDDQHTYINAAGRSPLLRASYEVACEAVAMKLQPWTFGDADQDRARKLFAQMCGARSDQIAVTPNCSYAISIAALNIPIAADQEILVLEVTSLCSLLRTHYHLDIFCRNTWLMFCHGKRVQKSRGQH